MFLILLAATAAVILGFGVWQTHSLHTTLVPKPLKRHLPRAISLLVVAAQLPELARVLEHISIVHIVTALMLLAIAMASGNTEESHLPL